MKDWKKFVTEEIVKGTPHSQIRKALLTADPKLSKNGAQKRVRKIYLQLLNAGIISASPETPAPAISANEVGKVKRVSNSFSSKTGRRTLEGTIDLLAGSDVNPDDLVAQYGLNPKEWQLKDYRISEYEAPIKGGGATVRYAFKIEVAPKMAKDFTERELVEFTNDSIDWVLSKHEHKLAAYAKALRENFSTVYNGEDGVVGEVVLTDNHIGMVASAKESGEDYGTEKACDQIYDANLTIFAKMERMKKSGVKFSKILLVTNGDLMHIDNDKQTTYNDTFQHVDKRFTDIHRAVTNLILKLVTLYAEIAPVEYIYIPGNHDRTVGEILADGWGRLFNAISDKIAPEGTDAHNYITSDVEPKAYKHRVIGECAVGWTHGDMSNDNLDVLMDNIVTDPNVILKCLHVGHRHVAALREVPHGYVENIVAGCPHDAWSFRKGFTAPPRRYVNAYIWDGTPVPPDKIVGMINP